MAEGIVKANVEQLLEPQIIAEIMQGMTTKSTAMQLFRRLPNGTSNTMKLRVLDALPVAYWVDSATNNGRKNFTSQAWDSKVITYEELAVIVPIKEDLLDDLSIDVWAEIRPRIEEAFAKKFDDAVFTGTGKPTGFRDGLLTAITSASATVTPTADQTLYSAINDAMTLVEESGYNVTGIVGGTNMRGKFRMMLDTTGQPLATTEIGSVPRYYIDNGAWNKETAQLVVGDFSQAVYSIRQDITFKLLTEAVIQDPSNGTIKYNLAQEDMVALRCVMRLGWEIPNPVNILSAGNANYFPFAAVLNAGE